MRALHSEQQYRAWADAPSSESAIAPSTPANATGAISRLSPIDVATINAPPIAPSVPMLVTPPDSPASTGCPDVMSRGVPPQRSPISVAQVSAAATASAADAREPQ